MRLEIRIFKDSNSEPEDFTYDTDKMSVLEIVSIMMDDFSKLLNIPQQELLENMTVGLMVAQESIG